MDFYIDRSRNTSITEPGFRVSLGTAMIYVRICLKTNEGLWSHMIGSEEDCQTAFDKLVELEFRPIFDTQIYKECVQQFVRLAEEEGFEPPVDFSTAD